MRDLRSVIQCEGNGCGSGLRADLLSGLRGKGAQGEEGRIASLAPGGGSFAPLRRPCRSSQRLGQGDETCGGVILLRIAKATCSGELNRA